MRTTLLTLLLLAALALVGCGTPGFMSPGTDGAPAVGTTVAQTARDQSTVPGVSTGGTGSGNIYNQFASQVPPEVALRMLEVAQAQNWTAEETIAAFKALAGAPTTVEINGDQRNEVNGGSAENLGAGSGGSGAASGGSVARP